MEGALGILLIGIGLYIVYRVMNGESIVPSTASGSGGESVQSYLRLRASNGGFK